MSSRPLLVLTAALASTMLAGQIPAPKAAFDPCEATIAVLHQKLEAHALTCRQIIEAHLARIAAYDQSTTLNALTVVNPAALAEADRLDDEFRRTGRLRPLHGVPMIVKDNYSTRDLPTTAGSAALQGFIPPRDAFVIQRLREAGAIILAKSNMAEWAFSPMLTESSTGGLTRNPYDLERVPAGSSGGTAAAIAASFGVIGLGTDTGNSIRGPSAHNCLVGVRSTMGLVSRAGVVPLYLRQDIAGPMTRTVEDAARVLDVIAGYDPADPVTRLSDGKIPPSYTQSLQRDGLKGARLGVFRRYIDAPTTDPAIRELMKKAVADLRGQGAIIVDPVDVPDFETLTRGLSRDTFRDDLQAWLASVGDKVPVKSLADVIASGKFLPANADRLKQKLLVQGDPPQDVYHEPRNIAFRDALLRAMDEAGVEALIYPTWSNPPRKVGDLASPAGDNSQVLSPQTGFPAITVPIGFAAATLPAGMTFVGRAFSEPVLLRLAYAYEQATHHRRPPSRFPPLPSTSDRRTP